jgi:hypothetical protein
MARLNLKDISGKIEWEDYLTPITFDEDYDIDAPKKLPMRLDLKKDNKVKVKKDSWFASHSNSRIHQFYSYMNNWIPTTLGQSVDDVYAKFCKKFPAYMGSWTNTREEFRSHLNMDSCESLRRRYKTRYSMHAGYYVDDNGIISHPGFEPVKRKEITIADKFVEIRYNIDPAIKKPELLGIIKKWFGNYWYDIFKNNDYLTEAQYNSLTRLDNYDNKICCGRKKWNIDHKGMIFEISFEPKYRTWQGGRYRINDDLYISSFLNQVKLFPSDAILYEGTKEYNRYIAELGDAKRKHRRESLKERLHAQETLLHDLEQMKKDKEMQLNIITRDRLGFDEDSFKGEFYHGQKRKKKI